MSAYGVPLSDGTIGTLEIGRHYPEMPGETGWITIDHADPRILITSEMVERIAQGECQPYAKIWTTCACSPGIRCNHFQGAKLEVRGRDQKVVYIIGEPDLTSWRWPAEWPD